MVLSMHNQAVKPFLQKYKSVFIGITLLLFAFMLLYLTDIISSNWPRYLAPVVFVFVLPTINRNSIPRVGYLERVGKHSYSVYLMHLIILELLLIAIETFFPNLLAYQLLLFPILFIAGVGGPVFFKESIKKLSLPKVCQNMF
jgi:peptidoglycan/LPS O-acetylase OafA/YrhL